ncbi:MAG: hypothetical protein H0W86_06955 [Armatimonadetes bacterium]|nr:hypothetical protein [Armatimonadota bacterium]
MSIAARDDAFSRLAESLPSDGDIEAQARGVLSILLERIRDGGRDVAPLENSPGTCPNCGTPTDSKRTPYCSERCKCVSAFVRRFRRSLAQGSLLEPEGQVALGQTFWHLMEGGRPLRVSIAPASAIKQVFKRTDGKCETCGAPATTVDNVGSG